MNYKEKMSQIGEVMDELVKRGLTEYLDIGVVDYCFINYKPNFSIEFLKYVCIVYGEKNVFFEYENSNWQKEFLSKVDELLENK